MELLTIHQIEITSRCNLRCRYCVHPTMPRAKQDMDGKTFARALALAHEMSRSAFQSELNLAGIGESTMHPCFLDYLYQARALLPARIAIVLATNGLLVDRLLAEAMARIRDVTKKPIKVWVSLHRPEKAGPAVEELKRVGLLSGVSADPSLAAVDWAGQVAWHTSTDQAGTVCPWLSKGRGFVASDGAILACCFDGSGASRVDGSGASRVGTVWDEPGTLRTGAHGLCKACHHAVPEGE